MKTSKMLLGAAAMVLASVAGNASAATIVGLYNTGVNNAGTVLAQGVTDGHYGLNGSGTPFTYNNGNYVQSSTATWIAANANGGYVVNPNAYTLRFDLGSLDPATASLSGLFAADNSAIVQLNGLQIGATNTFTSLTSFSTSTGFVSGVNTLTFTVTDTGQPSALLVTNLSGTAFATAVPEVATWGMMMVGFGMVGGALRYRKRSATVRFA